MDVRVIENPGEWNAYAEGFGAHPLQYAQWGALREQTGPWKATLLQFVEGGEPIGGAQVLMRSMPFPFRAICYAPRGPFAAEGHLAQVADALAAWGKAKTNATSVKVDPAVTELDLGPRWRVSEQVLLGKTATLSLEPPEDKIMAAIPNRKCRQYIRKAERDGVVVREAREEDLDAILALYHATADADGFALHEDGFYRSAFHALEGIQQLTVAEQDGEIQAFLWNVTSPGGTCFELWGAVSDAGKRSRANYYLKWCAIRAAKEAGAVLYDLNGLLNDGISDFKLLFVPEPTLWAPTHDMPLSPLYGLMNKALELRRLMNSRKSTQADTSQR